MSSEPIDFDSVKIRNEFLNDLQSTPRYAEHVDLIRTNDVVQTRVFKQIFKSSRVYDDDEGFFVYDISNPFYTTMHPAYIFQNETTFLEDWYIACDDYIKSLKPREQYILKRYTRHGDEIANALLRDPAGFSANPRVHELVFDKMPEEGHMLYAMQLIDKYHHNKHNEYLTDSDEFLAAEFHEIGLFETDYLSGIGIGDNRVILEALTPLIYEYIQDLRAILNKAPSLPAPLQVFRCTNTDYLNNPKKAAIVKGFLSTSLDSAITEHYHSNRYVYQMILQPGTPCLSIKNASRYYDEFEVLVDTDCCAMSTALVHKHNIQTDIHEGRVDPEHILIGPKNMQREVRHIQVMGSAKMEGGYKSSLKRSKSVKRMRTRSTISRKPTRSKRSSDRSSKRYSKRSSDRRSKRSSIRNRMKSKTLAWKHRDDTPPRVIYGKVPVSIEKQLLEAHKKMGTDFQNIAR